MFRPQIQKTKILAMMALINIILVLFISNSETYSKQSNFERKNEAVDKMVDYIDLISKSEVDIEDNDFYKTGLIGKYKTSITSKVDSSILKSKIITTHPNFAAFTIFLLEELDLNPGDYVAVSMTGSFPGANLALLAACDILDLNPIIISSLGSSSYGANRENYTWLDFENLLFENGYIKNKSIATSFGGVSDIGYNITDVGIELLEEKIFKSDVKFINEESLEKSINKKWALYNDESIAYKAFINIGGGVTSIGAGEGKDLMRGGIIYPISIGDLDEIYFASDDADVFYTSFKKSLAYKFLDTGIPFVNIKNIKSLVESHGVSELSNRENNRVKEGSLFYEVERFNIITIWLSLLISLSISILVGVYSHKQIKRRMLEDEIDSII